MTTERISRLLASAAVLAVASTAACAAPANDTLNVWASFAPLAYIAEEIAGPHAQVRNLTPPGADPHSQELSPARVADLAGSDLVVYLSGFQPATDEAIAQAAPTAVVDTAAAATASLPGESAPPDPERDPHFWLDPMRLGIAVDMVAEALADLDPEHSDDYTERAAALTDDLAHLDEEFRAALTPCEGATLVTSHEAFGFLAARYGLVQQGISGIDPEVEPSPARLRDLTEIIESPGVQTIYFEQAASPGVVQTLADDLGLRTDVLDPMERPQDPDYLATMHANLDALQRGLVCV